MMTLSITRRAGAIGLSSAMYSSHSLYGLAMTSPPTTSPTTATHRPPTMTQRTHVLGRRPAASTDLLHVAACRQRSVNNAASAARDVLRTSTASSAAAGLLLSDTPAEGAATRHALVSRDVARPPCLPGNSRQQSSSSSSSIRRRRATSDRRCLRRQNSRVHQ